MTISQIKKLMGTIVDPNWVIKSEPLVIFGAEESSLPS
jgi:hypothetical protein